ncbi:unnamed protein product [Linum trigynum]|uniref:Uncharacterized protein n=1 Tax=Linum trigynum TaxID=586398 RepID=A0AAV2DVG0_9ROSI
MTTEDDYEASSSFFSPELRPRVVFPTGKVARTRQFFPLFLQVFLIFFARWSSKLLGAVAHLLVLEEEGLNPYQRKLNLRGETPGLSETSSWWTMMTAVNCDG